MIERGNTADNVFRQKVKFQVVEAFAGLFAGLGFIEIGSEVSERYFSAVEDPISLGGIALTAGLGLFAAAFHEVARDIERDIHKLEES